MEAPEILYVRWTDHDCQGEGPWIDDDSAKELVDEPVTIADSIGWKIGESEHHICLCTTLSHGHCGPKVDRILKSNIIEMKKLDL